MHATRRAKELRDVRVWTVTVGLGPEASPSVYFGSPAGGYRSRSNGSYFL
nr:hypothetical protein Q903MT_gene5921 [Picea sitchensis]